MFSSAQGECARFQRQHGDAFRCGSTRVVDGSEAGTAPSAQGARRIRPRSSDRARSVCSSRTRGWSTCPNRTDGQDSHRDMAALDSSFSAFNGMAQSLSQCIELGQIDASQASASLLAVKDEVQHSVRDWARGLSEKSTRMVGELLEHQQEHLSMVSSSLRSSADNQVDLVLGSTADLVDAVIATARDHLATEAAAASRAKQLANDAATSEVGDKSRTR